MLTSLNMSSEKPRVGSSNTVNWKMVILKDYISYLPFNAYQGVSAHRTRLALPLSPSRHMVKCFLDTPSKPPIHAITRQHFCQIIEEQLKDCG